MHQFIHPSLCAAPRMGCKALRYFLVVGRSVLAHAYQCDVTIAVAVQSDDHFGNGLGTVDPQLYLCKFTMNVAY